MYEKVCKYIGTIFQDDIPTTCVYNTALNSQVCSRINFFFFFAGFEDKFLVFQTVVLHNLK